jgi:hypothetical protein
MKTVKDVVDHKHPSPKVVKASAPNLCDICRGTLRTGSSFFDGKTVTGPWAWMCSVCFGRHGIGIGTGRGQKYNSKTNEKEAG